MPHLAWFTPLPPVRSGIAQYNCELLPFLASSHQLDVFVDGSPEFFHTPDQGVGLFSAYDFIWKNRKRPYDLVVYQLGNAPCHDYMWAYMARYPGLVVLHDGQLHHARGRMLLQQWKPRQGDYREEFWFNHPDARKDVAELGVAGLLGSLTYLWPMLRVAVEASRHVLVHNDWLAAQVRLAHPQAMVTVVEMGVPQSAPRPDARQRIRSRHGIPNDAVVFSSFGRITPEKRIREAIQALAALIDVVPNARILLAGEIVDYYDMAGEARSLGVQQQVAIAGYVGDDEIDDYLAASDVCLCMRWPTSRETSASWLRCLAAGRPTISTDLVHTIDVPTLDPRSWSTLAGLKRRAAEGETMLNTQPVGVSIDILDESHSLKLALRRLAADEKLRSALGENARELWQNRFRLELMAEGYADAIAKAVHAPMPSANARATLPRHLQSTGAEYAEELLEPIVGSSAHDLLHRP